MLKRLLSLLCALLLTLGAFPALAATPKPIDVIPYEDLPEPLDGQYHYLLLCEDLWADSPTRDGKPRGNTDGIVLVTLDTRARRVMLTSFIRDALVSRPNPDKPGDGIGRINYIAKQSGPETLCRVISQHIGVKVDKYIIFTFKHVSDIIDHLGGVTITVTAEEASYLNRYRISRTSTKPSMASAGTYLFGGHAAVIYMRIRKAGGGGDFMRTQRVRTVLSTLADQCREITYDEARNLVNVVLQNNVVTNINLETMVDAMEHAFELRGCTVEELRIPPEGAVHPISYVGMAAQELDWDKCRVAMADYLENSFLVYTPRDDTLLDDLEDLEDFDWDE
ncbi:MAG: LCP family protein [Clostridia bacterium]|nr:LCP family protein [Clostridia bacterium]